MSVPTLPVDPGALDLRAALPGLLFGLGLYLILTAQPIGRPKPDLRERLSRLDVDERIRLDLARPSRPPLFASRLLEALLRPLIEDLGRLARGALGRVGLAGGQELERRLRLARPEIGPAQFFGEKVATGLVVLGVFPVMNSLGIHPLGAWPLWAWLVGFAVGYLAPDWQLDQRLATRRTECLMELPTALDLLTICASAGLALEQAVAEVGHEGEGLLARELNLAGREAALGRRTLLEALEAMAERNGVPELTGFVGQLLAGQEQGIPIVQTLSAQAEALREQKRLRIVEEGGKASVRMLVPVTLFIFPVVLVVLLYPAMVQLLGLAGPG